MKAKLEARRDFENVIYNNPIELLSAIKQHALNYQESRCEMSVIADGFTTFFGTRQKDGEHLQDYTRRFKTRQRCWRHTLEVQFNYQNL